MALLSFLDRERSIAKPRLQPVARSPCGAGDPFSSIGQAYAFSVFNKPLTKLIAVSHSSRQPTRCVALSQSKLVDAVTAAPADWSIPRSRGCFSIAIVFLGLSAAVFGAWLERVGPRKAMFASALCFSGGFFIGRARRRTSISSGFSLLGYGVLGGIGLGLGYISPVSTLIKWFPDRPGMATGHGDHGIRRRRDDRGAALGEAHGLLHAPSRRSACRRRSSAHRRDLFRLHDVRRVHGARAAAGLEPAGYVPPAHPCEARAAATTCR